MPSTTEVKSDRAAQVPTAPPNLLSSLACLWAVPGATGTKEPKPCKNDPLETGSAELHKAVCEGSTEGTSGKP